MYSGHDGYTMCDYCVPSACLRALLRLLTACGTATAAAAITTATISDGPNGASASISPPQSSTSRTPSPGPVAAAPVAAVESSSSGGGVLPAAAMTPIQDGAGRLVAAGGLFSLFLLLHHELSGVHHSKMAASLVSLLILVLDAGLDVQV